MSRVGGPWSGRGSEIPLPDPGKRSRGVLVGSLSPSRRWIKRGPGAGVIACTVLLAGAPMARPLQARTMDADTEGSCSPVQIDTIKPWFAGLRHEREFIGSDLPHWTDWIRNQGVIVRDLDGGAIGGEFFQVERFGLKDRGVALDIYRDLWRRSYGNLRLRTTPDADVLPRVDVRLEIFQALASGWETSGSYWRMDFTENDVDIFGVGLAEYYGNWYFRGVASMSTLAGSSAFSFSSMARRFLDPPREYVEVSTGIGREVVVLGPGPTVEVRDTRFLQGRLQKFFNSRWGLSAGLMYNRFSGAPERVGFSLGLITRF